MKLEVSDAEDRCADAGLARLEHPLSILLNVTVTICPFVSDTSKREKRWITICTYGKKLTSDTSAETPPCADRRIRKIQRSPKLFAQMATELRRYNLIGSMFLVKPVEGNGSEPNKYQYSLSSDQHG